MVVVVAGILDEVVAMVTVSLPGAFSLQVCHKGSAAIRTLYIQFEILKAVGLICELICKHHVFLVTSIEHYMQFTNKKAFQ